IHAGIVDFRAAAGVEHRAGRRVAGRVRRAHPATAGRRVRCADRQGPPGPGLLHSGLRPPDAGPDCRNLAARRGREVVRRRCRAVEMTAMNTSAIATMSARLEPVASHAPWRRFEVDAPTWTAIAKSLGEGEADLLGLWGDAGAVHMA